ncbi:dihydroorotate dehydrogenase (quinone) [Actinorhabdospora filicis]|uniref:Dihydroorotate dehydrogenase (quinone) n=1 Tax=Actinorhabdospora filicis TaxID=1785913 RepID=A0A9W6SG59_9ACTN|nr:quinone-dependent dihydroorotate dehydrogenase [Actinorhabdospora filicis]GLZ75272.1 dihydroorotate dehydrogenase (quinone) [Actinorhabdospora filicis]
MLYERLVRPLLFKFGGADPEDAHERTMRALGIVSRSPRLREAVLGFNARACPTTVFGVKFPNPVGLAAGMDKDGRALAAWPALGFGFVEVGTVTWRPQPGNPRPRLYRLPESRALINRMGFNNRGAVALAARLADGARPGVPLGISLGKSKVTPLEEAVGDYLASLRVLYEFGDYFAVNVSSPNTPGLRGLQDAGQLRTLLGALREETERLAATTPGGNGRPKPVLVKIAPDLDDKAVADVIEVCGETGVAGLIATNTTLSRDGVAESDRPRSVEPGGLSGRPLGARARQVVAFAHRESGGRLPIIGVGGIDTPDDAARMFDAGASLVQLYTGFIYSGPSLPRRIALAARGAASRPGTPTGDDHRA